MKGLLIASFLVLFVFSGFNKSQNNTKENSIYKVDTTIYSTLKAVLIVGHQEDGINSPIYSMERIAAFFQSKGIEVQPFYDEKADWNDIKAAANVANIFVYDGHGTTLGIGGRVGGLRIIKWVSSKDIIEDLELSKNALVLFKSVCFGAGSSAGDDGDIGIDEALKRVSDYS